MSEEVQPTVVVTTTDWLALACPVARRRIHSDLHGRNCDRLRLDIWAFLMARGCVQGPLRRRRPFPVRSSPYTPILASIPAPFRIPFLISIHPLI